MATSLIPDGVIDNFKLSKKFVTMEQGIRTTDSGGIYTAFTPTSDSVNNDVTLTNEAIGNVVLITSIVSNQPAIPVSTPKPIEVVDRDLIASNHHSVYAYNGLTYASSGKIATGSSFESMVVEDVVISNNKSLELPTSAYGYGGVLSAGVAADLKIGYMYYSDGSIIDSYVGYYIRKGTNYSGTPTINWNVNNDIPTLWWYIGNFFTNVPIHNPITLDNQSIVASKVLLTQTSNATQVFTQELDYDSTAGDFGDDNQFDQLTSGTLTDLNGHSVNTKILLKPSSIKLGE